MAKPLQILIIRKNLNHNYMANTSYQKAYDELQTIVTRLQNDEIGLDDLSKSVKRAGVLIQSCKEKLRNVELEIDQLFDNE